MDIVIVNQSADGCRRGALARAAPCYTAPRVPWDAPSPAMTARWSMCSPSRSRRGS
jgi:hypothetical protein